jgi:cytochrome c oxidase cbb3-type subunit III
LPHTLRAASQCTLAEIDMLATGPMGPPNIPGARRRVCACLLVCAPLIGLPAFAQFSDVKNPSAGNPTAIAEGESLFRANCSPCHGFAGHGGSRGPDLTTGLWIHGGSDREIFNTISQGVPGTDMPANAFEDGEIWALVAYLRSIGASPAAPSSGDRAAGEQVFQQLGCPRCHMIQGKGGHLGPELTRVGAARSFAYLVASIRDPDKDLSVIATDPNNHYAVPIEWLTVTVETRSGQKIVGTARNEDAFTIQLFGEDDSWHLLRKQDLASVRHERRSLMPAYNASTLGDEDLRNLMAYLTGLRGADK